MATRGEWPTNGGGGGTLFAPYDPPVAMRCENRCGGVFGYVPEPAATEDEWPKMRGGGSEPAVTEGDWPKMRGGGPDASSD